MLGKEEGFSSPLSLSIFILPDFSPPKKKKGEGKLRENTKNGKKETWAMILCLRSTLNFQKKIYGVLYMYTDIYTHIYIHTLEKFSFPRKKKIQKSFGFSSEILWNFYCHFSVVVVQLYITQYSYHWTSSGCPQYTTPQLLILASKSIHRSAASYLSLIPYSRLRPHLPSAPITYILFPSPFSYGASSLNYSASVQPVFKAGSSCLRKLISLIY